MKFHISNLGAFGGGIPTDRNGYVTCSPRRVESVKSAIRRGKTPPKWADRGANRDVAEAELAIAEWQSD